MRYRFFTKTLEEAGALIERWGGAAAQLSDEVTLFKDSYGDGMYVKVAYLGEFDEDEEVES